MNRYSTYTPAGLLYPMCTRYGPVILITVIYHVQSSRLFVIIDVLVPFHCVFLLIVSDVKRSMLLLVSAFCPGTPAYL